MQAVHAGLKHEPKMKPKTHGLWSRISHSIKWGISHQKKKEWEKIWKNKNNKNPFPFPQPKRQWMEQWLKSSPCCIPLDWEIMGILKLLKLLAEKPQCKSLGNTRNVSTDPTLGILWKELYFQPEVTAPHSAQPSVRAGHTHHLVPHVSMGSGSQAQLWDLHAGKQQICRMAPVHTHKKHLWLGHHTALRSSPLGEAAHGEALGTGRVQLVTKNRCTMFIWWAVITIQKHKAQAFRKAKIGIKQTIHREALNWNDCKHKEQPPKTSQGPQSEPLVFSKTANPCSLLKPQVRFLISTRLVSHATFFLSNQLVVLFQIRTTLQE